MLAAFGLAGTTGCSTSLTGLPPVGESVLKAGESVSILHNGRSWRGASRKVHRPSVPIGVATSKEEFVELCDDLWVNVDASGIDFGKFMAIGFVTYGELRRRFTGFVVSPDRALAATFEIRLRRFENTQGIVGSAVFLALIPKTLLPDVFAFYDPGGKKDPVVVDLRVRH